MAEGILFDIVGRLIEELGSLVIKEIGLACGVKEEIRKLKETVETIQVVLQDAEAQHSKKNQQVTLWLLKLKEVVYDADDLLDDFATELKQQEVMTGNRTMKEVRIFFSTSNQLAYSLKMAHKIKDIREKLDDIEKNRRFHLDENLVPQNVERETHSLVPADEVIGRDEDKEHIIGRLLDLNDVENVSVIPIVGRGGLGKTTLAKMIYNDERIKNHFQLRMWACVSNIFAVRIIVKNIKISRNVKNIYVEELANLYRDEPQERLHKEISGKKYLLVLDDVWNENHEKWYELINILMNDIRGNKILITTHSEQVAKITSKLPCHILKGLNVDQSWSLFTKMAFEHGIEETGSKLVEIGKCIINKCAGVPFTIRTIARLLHENNTEDYWLHFMEDELSQIDQEDNDILPILKLSYDHLPSHLKQCFAYCALFPKGYKIKKDYLIDLWMAQGFLQSSNMDQSLEEIGNNYLTNLVSRSFFQDIKYDDWGNVVICKMHDLATKVAGSECTILKSDASNYQAKARHISFDSLLNFSWEIPTVLLEKNHIRTFLLPNEIIPYFVGNKSNFEKILSSFRCLRTLHLLGSNIEKLPNSIDKLKHLRYLNMSSNQNITKLPSSLWRLQNLQILKLNNCYSLKKLPRDIIKIVSLRCLMMERCTSLVGLPRGLSLLTNLRTISDFVIGSKGRKYAKPYELYGLKNLSGELKIRSGSTPKMPWWSNLLYGQSSFNEEVLEWLQPHHNLEALRISKFMGLRIGLSSLTNLTSIEIFDCERCQRISRLDQLPSLNSLRLQRLGDLECIISEKGSNDSSSTSSTSFFPSLKTLTISACRNLKGWWTDVDNDNDDVAMELPSIFPCLSKLEIIDCPNLSCMPLYPSLEELYLDRAWLRPLQQTMNLMNTATPSASSTVSHTLSNLKSLYIDECKKLEFLTNVDDKRWKGFTSLNSITFRYFNKIVSLPQWLQHVPNLQNLNIGYCRNLMDLPEGMQLQVLEIEECPQLSERCGNNKGVYWPKISHIPNIQIDDKWIQKEGSYQLNTEGSSSASTAS